MRALAEVGVRTPEVVDTRNGDVLAGVEAGGVPEPRYCDLSRWIDGAQLGDSKKASRVIRAGRRVVPNDRAYRGRRARARRSLAASDAFVRPVWDEASLVGDTPAFGDFRDSRA